MKTLNLIIVCTLTLALSSLACWWTWDPLYDPINLDTEIELFVDNTPSEQLNPLVEKLQELRNLMQDKRYLLCDRTMTTSNHCLSKWLDIYRRNESCSFQYIPISSGIKMIAEAKVPNNEMERLIQLDNLAWYRERGYNACLLSIYLDEKLSDLLDLVNEIVNLGYSLYITYTGIDSLETSVLLDPDKLRWYLSSLAPLSRGLILGWRKTSANLFIQDAAFTNHLIKSVRITNPDIEIIGEAYYGETAHTELGVTYNVPECSSAVILIGIGYRCVHIAKVIDELFATIPKSKQLGVVLGDYPHYHHHSNQRSFEENFKIKQYIEQQFINAGTIGTITLHGDGYSHLTDSLTSARY